MTGRDAQNKRTGGSGGPPVREYTDGQAQRLHVMGKAIQTFLDYPPMQRGASFNLGAIKAELGSRMEEAEKASKDPSQ